MHNNVFNFFSGIPSFFHQTKSSYFDFGPSALRLRMEESAVIFAAYDVRRTFYDVNYIDMYIPFTVRSAVLSLIYI